MAFKKNAETRIDYGALRKMSPPVELRCSGTKDEFLSQKILMRNELAKLPHSEFRQEAQ